MPVPCISLTSTRFIPPLVPPLPAFFCSRGQPFSSSAPAKTQSILPSCPTPASVRRCLATERARKTTGRAGLPAPRLHQILESVCGSSRGSSFPVMAGSSAEQGEVCGMIVGLWGQHGPSRQYQARTVCGGPWSKEAVPRPVLWRQHWNEWVMPSKAGVEHGPGMQCPGRVCEDNHGLSGQYPHQ